MEITMARHCGSRTAAMLFLALTMVYGVVSSFSPHRILTHASRFIQTTKIPALRSESNQELEAPKVASFVTSASENPNPITAVNEILENWSDNSELAFLFVGQYHAGSFPGIVDYVNEKIKNKASSKDKTINILAVLGGGVIGGGHELDNSRTPSMSLMSGSLPPQSNVEVFSIDGASEESGDDSSLHTTIASLKDYNSETNDRPPSYMVLSDPFFSSLENFLTQLEKPVSEDAAPAVIAGGISVPQKMNQPSLALNGKILAPGSLVGAAFMGNVGLMAVVAQGCRGVGPTFVVTQASGTILTGLSGKTAISQLEDVAKQAEEQDQELIRNGELVCGIGSSSVSPKNNVSKGDEKESLVRVEDDFLIRQIMGFQPKSGSIVVAAGGLKEGNTFRFHVRAAQSAREDMELMIQRAKTERLFAGSSLLKKGPRSISIAAGKPMAALQISCVARGESFFGSHNVDLQKVQKLFDGAGAYNDKETETLHSSAPIAGFYANGEIGPVGIRMAEMATKENAGLASKSGGTFLHGFTTVVAMLCDYSDAETIPSEEVSSDTIISSMDEDAWA
jgi:small ligand-binding sensory domain FIST